MDVTQARGSGRSGRQTQTSTWGELIDRVPLLNEDGSRDELNPELAAALLSTIGISGPRQRQAFLNELLPALGIGSVDDLGGASLTEVLEGIFAG